MIHIPTESEKLFNQLKSEHYLEGLNGSKMPEKLAGYLSESIHSEKETEEPSDFSLNFLHNEMDMKLISPISVLMK